MRALNAVCVSLRAQVKGVVKLQFQSSKFPGKKASKQVEDGHGSNVARNIQDSKPKAILERSRFYLKKFWLFV